MNKKVRSIFISDIHLGCKHSKAKQVTNFLKKYEPEYLYLVGDIIDGWKLKRRWYWNDDHSFLIRSLIGLIKKNTKIIYLAGNHDEFLRPFAPNDYGSVHITNEIIHTTASGKKYLILHGDEFDFAIKNSRMLAVFGDMGYDLMVSITDLMHWWRKETNLRHWSFSEYIKRNVKKAVNFIGNFEKCVVTYAKHKSCDGVICGHIHTATIKEVDGISYCNTGDWVETCSGIVEHMDGNFELLLNQYDWNEHEENKSEEKTIITYSSRPEYA